MERSKRKYHPQALIRDSMNFRQPSYGSSYNISRMTILSVEKSLYATTAAFKDLPVTLPTLPENELHAMHLYVIEYDQRNELMKYLRSHQIGASLHYPLAVHQHTAYANRIRGGDNLTSYRTVLSKKSYPTDVPGVIE